MLSDAAVAESRRKIHEALVGSPAWVADAVREELARLEAALRAHYLNEGAELIGTASEERLDEISEENLEPRHWDRHHAWLDAANVLKKAAGAGQ